MEESALKSSELQGSCDSMKVLSGVHGTNAPDQKSSLASTQQETSSSCALPKISGGSNQPLGGSRVDHWASIRDKSSFRLLEPKLPTIRDDRQTLLDRIAALELELAARDAEVDRLNAELELRSIVSKPHQALKMAKAVAKARGVSFAEMIGERRSAYLVRTRQEAMWLLKEKCGLSLPQIGRILGGRDHTTILHGIRRHVRRLAGEIE